MGLSFKEDCPDIRNTKVIDIIAELKEYSIQVDVYDPWVKYDEAEKEYGIMPVADLKQGLYDAMVLAVAHYQFKEMGTRNIRDLGKPSHVLYDLKYVFTKEEADIRL